MDRKRELLHGGGAVGTFWGSAQLTRAFFTALQAPAVTGGHDSTSPATDI